MLHTLSTVSVFILYAKETLFVKIPLSDRIAITVYIPYSHVLSSYRGYSG